VLLTNCRYQQIFDKAKEYALFLLKFRIRTKSELYLRLEKKGFEKKLILKVLALLEKHGIINDKEYARFWAESRINKHYGFIKIRRELIKKGISEKIIDSIEKRLQSEFPEEEIILKAAEEKLKKINEADPQKKKIKLYGYLLRRGFTEEAIEKTINESRYFKRKIPELF
jgi:regulatory protein